MFWTSIQEFGVQVCMGAHLIRRAALVSGSSGMPSSSCVPSSPPSLVGPSARSCCSPTFNASGWPEGCSSKFEGWLRDHTGPGTLNSSSKSASWMPSANVLELSEKWKRNWSFAVRTLLECASLSHIFLNNHCVFTAFCWGCVPTHVTPVLGSACNNGLSTCEKALTVHNGAETSARVEREQRRSSPSCPMATCRG
jgi:hypothetical protein